MLVNKDAYQRETLIKWLVRLPLKISYQNTFNHEIIVNYYNFAIQPTNWKLHTSFQSASSNTHWPQWQLDILQSWGNILSLLYLNFIHFKNGCDIITWKALQYHTYVNKMREKMHLNRNLTQFCCQILISFKANKYKTTLFLESGYFSTPITILAICVHSLTFVCLRMCTHCIHAPSFPHPYVIMHLSNAHQHFRCVFCTCGHIFPWTETGQMFLPNIKKEIVSQPLFLNWDNFSLMGIYLTSLSVRAWNT